MKKGTRLTVKESRFVENELFKGPSSKSRKAEELFCV